MLFALVNFFFFVFLLTLYFGCSASSLVGVYFLLECRPRVHMGSAVDAGCPMACGILLPRLVTQLKVLFAQHWLPNY